MKPSTPTQTIDVHMEEEEKNRRKKQRSVDRKSINTGEPKRVPRKKKQIREREKTLKFCIPQVL